MDKIHKYYDKYMQVYSYNGHSLQGSDYKYEYKSYNVRNEQVERLLRKLRSDEADCSNK